MSSNPIKVAIVDDEQDILEMIEKFLKRGGNFEVTSLQIL